MVKRELEEAKKAASPEKPKAAPKRKREEVTPISSNPSAAKSSNIATKIKNADADDDVIEPPEKKLKRVGSIRRLRSNHGLGTFVLFFGSTHFNVLFDFIYALFFFSIAFLF